MAFSFIPSNDPAERKKIFSWQMYDWANSAFVTVMVTAIMPLYFTEAVMSKSEQANNATNLWSLLATISSVGVALAALFLGPLADVSPRKKRYLGLFTLMGATATVIIAISPPHAWLLISGMFVVGYIGFSSSMIFYDAMLPSLAGRDNLDNVSSGGYAIGYVGGGLCLALCIALMLLMPTEKTLAIRIGFGIVAVWWLVFSIPLFRNVPEPAFAGGANAIVAPRRLRDTFRHLLQSREAFKFLIAFWIYNDGVSTIIKISVSYAVGVVFKGQDMTTHLMAAILMIQFLGMPAAYLWAFIAQRIGPKICILLCLVVYSIVSVLAYFMSDIWHFYALGALVALGQGGVQALSRSMFASHIPANRETEFFGFYNISGKFAAILGPLVFFIIGQFSNSPRLAILSLIGFFVVGGAILMTVKDAPIEPGVVTDGSI